MRGPQSGLAVLRHLYKDKPEGQLRESDLYPTAQTDAGLPAEECPRREPG
jgi:hypothetical protein